MKSARKSVPHVVGVIALVTGYWALSATASAEVFIRPAFWNVAYTNPSFHSDRDFANPLFHSQRGRSLAAGITLGTRQAHELSLELASVPWSYEDPVPGMQDSGPSPFRLGTTASGHYMPLLVNYRFYLGDAARKLRCYAAVSLGATKVTGEATMVLSGPRYAWTGSDWSTTYGGAAGVSWRMAPHISLDIGYRYLRIKGADLGTANWPNWVAASPLHFHDAVAHVFSGGLTFGF